MNRLCDRPVGLVGTLVILLLAPVVCSATDRLVGTQAELLSALAASGPGDSVTLRNGVWSNLSVNFQSINGASGAPVRIRAQTPGQVVIAGPSYFFDVGGNHYEVSGLTFRDENAIEKAIRFRGTAANVRDNAVLMGGRYNAVLFDARPAADGTPSRFRSNFLAGKQDRGVTLVLDNSFRADVSDNYFGFRPQGGPGGNTNGWETIRIGTSGIMDRSLEANVQGNLFASTNGEAETISDKTRNNRIADNTFRSITLGWVTARHGGAGVYEGNSFFNALGIRVGNDDDAIPDHPGLTIRNNYIEGPNAKILVPGNQTDVSIERNTVIATAGGAYNNAGYTNGRFPLEYTNTTAGRINQNLIWISDATHAAVQAGTASGIAPSAIGTGNVAFNAGSGAVFTSSTPTAIRNLFSTSNPNLLRDAYGRLRPTTGSAGVEAMATPLARNSNVGPRWLDPVMRLNKMMPVELTFDARLSNGVTSSNADNTGYLSTPATMRTSGGAAVDQHSAAGLGVSGLASDRAFDNRVTAGMGNTASGRAALVDRTWFRNLEAFTLTGWFKTDGAQSIGNGASLIEQVDGAGGWSLRATTTGALTLSINNGSTTRSVTSDLAYATQDAWVFFAVTFDARPSSNEVSFYVGSESVDISLAGQRSLNLSNSSDGVRSDLMIGLGFDGLIDNVRLFSARRTHVYVDDTGNSFTKNGNGQDDALLSLAELRTIRRHDLGIPPGDLDESRTIDAADIDLLSANSNNPRCDIDGDGAVNRADRELLIGGILGTVPGDANLDRRVDFADLLAVAQSYNRPSGWASGDFTGDGLAGFSDLLELAQNYGWGTSVPSSFESDIASLVEVGYFVPEPTMASGLAVSVVLLRRRRGMF